MLHKFSILWLSYRYNMNMWSKDLEKKSQHKGGNFFNVMRHQLGALLSTAAVVLSFRYWGLNAYPQKRPPILFNELDNPQTAPSREGSGPRVTHGARTYISQSPKQYLDRFIRFCTTANRCDQYTQTDRHTDPATCTWCNLKTGVYIQTCKCTSVSA